MGTMTAYDVLISRNAKTSIKLAPRRPNNTPHLIMWLRPIFMTNLLPTRAPNKKLKDTEYYYFDDKNFVLEAFKKKDINSLNNKKLISNYNYDNLIKFRQFY